MSRILDHPVLGKIEDRNKVTFQFDGKTYEAYKNETIAAALLANDVRKLRVHEESGTPRGIYCNIGHCMECRVTVNGQANIRACLTVVEKDMEVESGKQLPNIVKRMVEEA
ncbi:(2Fe-2S)-binding protein [Neobacillus mesonae]|uniref:(2Fe-2S)-binding protein n=1 Tax=Neobacillus mesonae TaxID=1193713 RepID=UPI00082A713A|nr:(2Fe-2S)-binding protein [Neobacillus mesonae]